MPATLTLKGISEEVYAQLRMSAEVNRRSLSSEAIACLETVLLPRKTGATEHAARAREIRQDFRGRSFEHEAIDRFKREGCS